MGLIKLNVFPRQTTGKNENRRTRAAGHIPAVIYGNDRDATTVQLETVEFTRILQKTGGRAVIFDINLEGESENPIALMRDLQQHPVTDEIRHVDLYEIPRGKPVEVQIGVAIQGEPACAKFNEGAVVRLVDSVTVRCLPREMPESVTIDVSELEINDSLYVRDLVTSAGEIMEDPEMQVLVVKTVSLFIEEEEAEEVEGAEGAEGEEGEDGEDGEDGGGESADDTK